MNVFNGVKTFAIFWVIFGHEYFYNLGVASNALSFSALLQTPFYLVVEAAMLAVDCFFFMGGDSWWRMY